MIGRVAATVLALIVAAGLAEAAPSSARIGALLLDYDDTKWRVIAGPDGAVVTPTDCPEPRCGRSMGVLVTIGPAVGPLPDAIPPGEGDFTNPLWPLMNDLPAWQGDGPIREINGFVVFATDRWSGCRANSPSELTAILDHDGRRYTFTSGVAAACAGIWGVGRDAFVDILTQLRPHT